MSTTIEAPAADVWAVLLDVEHYTDFVPYLEEARAIESSDGRLVLYQRIDPPFAKPRDYTLDITLTEDSDAGVYRQTWTTANDLGPSKRKGTVRIQHCTGSWAVEAIQPGVTKLTYSLSTDPGGAIPAWGAKVAQKQSFPKLLRAIGRRATARRP